jgi:mycothiol synthase
MTTFTLFPGRVEDLDDAVPMFNLTSQKFSGKDEFDLTDYRAEWTLPTFDVAADTRVARAEDGTLIGVVELWNNSAPYVLNRIWGRVHPNYEGQGVGTALMEWAESRAHEKLELAAPENRVQILCNHISQNDAAKSLFEDLGYQVQRYSFLMEVAFAEMPLAPQLPDGITIRAMIAPDEYEAIHRVDMEAFRDHWGFVERPFEVTFAEMMHLLNTRGTHDPALYFVALDGERIVGISLCNLESLEEHSAGYVDALAVRREYRKRGVGLALLRHSFRELYRRGKHKVQLGVDAGNLTGALRLYQNAGMQVFRQYNQYEKELRPGKNLMTKA